MEIKEPSAHILARNTGQSEGYITSITLHMSHVQPQISCKEVYIRITVSLQFVNSSVDASIARCCASKMLTVHVLRAISLYMGNQPWMLCLTGPGAVKCASSTLHKAKTSSVSPS